MADRRKYDYIIVGTWQRGWITGGSTTINGAVWNRGEPYAYDASIEPVGDMNAPAGDRVSRVTSSTRRGFRRSAARTFLSPACRRKNVTVKNNAGLMRVLFLDKVATGVEANVRGTPT